MGQLELRSGTLIDVLNPKEKDFLLADICTGLANQSRFGGHTSRPYTVLHHSINCYFEAVARGFDFETVKLCFAHDFTEGAGLVDIPSPLKQVLPEYYVIEANWQNNIYSRFGILGDSELLKQVDYDMAIYEARELMPSKAADFRWKKPTIDKPCNEVANRLLNIPSVEESIEEFWYLCDILNIKE